MIVLQWVSDGSPSHSHATKIENNNQFVPVNTNPKEFKKVQKLVRSPLKISYSSLISSFQLENCLNPDITTKLGWEATSQLHSVWKNLTVYNFHLKTSANYGENAQLNQSRTLLVFQYKIKWFRIELIHIIAFFDIFKFVGIFRGILVRQGYLFSIISSILACQNGYCMQL